MQKVLTQLKKNEGYISIETIIVAGLIIGLGAFAISQFQNSANGVTETALDQVNDVQSNYDNLPGNATP